MKTDLLVDYLQIWGLEDDMIVFKDASIGVGLSIGLYDPSTKSDDALNEYGQQLTTFLNGLPSGLWVQFVRDIDEANPSEFSTHVDLISPNADATAVSLAKSRVDGLTGMAKAAFLKSHKGFLFLRIPADSGQKITTWNPFKSRSTDDIQRSAIDQTLQKAKKIRDDVVSMLGHLGLSPKVLGSQKLMEILYKQWNPDRRIGLPAYDPDDVREALVLSDVEIERSGFTVGKTHHRVLSLKILPDTTHSAMADALERLPYGSRLLTSIYVPDQVKEIESLQTQRRVAYSMAVGKKTGVSDIDSTAKFNDLEGLLDQMIASGEKVFHFATNVVLKSQSERDLEDQVSETLSLFRTLGGAEAIEENLAAFDIFSQIAIPNAKTTERIKRIKTSNLADLLAVYGPWSGHALPRVLLKTRQDTILALDPFDQGLTNANQLISGASGAGKSFLTNILILNMLKEMPRVFFVDIGGSYRRLCENLGGHYINLAAGSEVALNPFDLVSGEITPSPSKIKFLLGLIEIITKEDHETRLPKLVRAEIEHAIGLVYKDHANPRLTHLKDTLLKNSDPVIQNYVHHPSGTSLRPFNIPSFKRTAPSRVTC